jgi:hypothetical protein
VSSPVVVALAGPSEAVSEPADVVLVVSQSGLSMNELSQSPTPSSSMTTMTAYLAYAVVSRSIGSVTEMRTMTD